MRRKLESYGVRTLFGALVLAFLGGIAWFPVWSTGPTGTGMRILLGYVNNEPAAFVLDRLLPAAAVLGALGVGMTELGPVDQAHGPRSWLTRERIALLIAVVTEGALLGSFGLLASVGTDLLPVYAGVGAVVTVATSLYLLWTAERLGSAAGAVLLAAAAAACGCAGLASVIALLFQSRPPDVGNAFIVLDLARWLFGEVSLGLWIVAYSGIALRDRVIGSTVRAAG